VSALNHCFKDRLGHQIPGDDDDDDDDDDDC